MSDRGVSVLVLYNDEGRMLLQHRSSYKKRWADHWGTFGGGINDDETPEQALAREAHEEMGYAVQNPELLFVQELPGGAKYVFVEKYNDQELTIDPAESQNHRWLTIDEMRELTCIPHDFEACERVNSHLMSVLDHPIE